MTTRILVATAALAALAGCAGPAADPFSEQTFGYDQTQAGFNAPAAISTAPISAAPTGQGYDPAREMVEVDPYNRTVDNSASGLTERLPDTCHLERYQQYQGRTAVDVNAAGLSVPFRMVGPRDIVTQEYNPMRVNFYTGPDGLIAQISCG